MERDEAPEVHEADDVEVHGDDLDTEVHGDDAAVEVHGADDVTDE